MTLGDAFRLLLMILKVDRHDVLKNLQTYHVHNHPGIGENVRVDSLALGWGLESAFS